MALAAGGGAETLDGMMFFGQSAVTREAQAGDLNLTHHDARPSIFDAAIEAEEFGGTFLQEVRNAIDFEEY